MFNTVSIAQAFIALLGVSFSGLWRVTWTRARPLPYPPISSFFIGAMVCFFDTLGIGNYATTTAALRARKMVADDLIPGTLNVGLALPAIMEALIYLVLIKVDLTLLVACVAASTVGAWFGAGIVSRLNIRTIRLSMGGALILFSVLFAARGLGLFPQGGSALALEGAKFAIALVAFAVLGGLMAVGIGLYAPAMVVLCLLGLDLKAVFPIMMTAAAFIGSATGARFLRSAKVSMPVALGLALAGIPAVLFAAFVVREISLDILRWIVVAVVLYAGTSLLRAGLASPGWSIRKPAGVAG